MNESTVRKLSELRLHGMADKLRELAQSPKYTSLTHEELVAHMVDHEYDRRRNGRVQRLLKNAKIKIANACLEDIEYSAKRNIKKEQIQNILDSRFLENHHNLLISGPTGVGKTYLACAFAQMACRQGYPTLYVRTSRLLETIKQDRMLGNYMKSLDRLGKTSLLVVDDIGPDIMTKEEKDIAARFIGKVKGPVLDWFTYDGAYLSLFPKERLFAVDLTDETSKYTKEAARRAGKKIGVDYSQFRPLQIHNNGKFELVVIKDGSSVEELKTAIKKIESDEGLFLEYENKEGDKLVLKKELVKPGDPRYIYAVNDELAAKYGFKTDMK